MTTFAPTRAIGVDRTSGFRATASASVLPRILDSAQRRSAKGIARFPEHAPAVVSHLAPYEARNLLDKELANILKIARSTVAFNKKAH
jgi:hypothetical protein